MFDKPVKIKMKLSTQEQVLLFVHFIRSVNFTNKLEEDQETKKLIQKIWDGFYSPEFESLVLINIDVSIMLKIWDMKINNIDRFVRDFLKIIFPDKNDDELNVVYAYAIGEVRKRMVERDFDEPNADLLFDLLIEFEGSIINELVEKHYGRTPEEFAKNFSNHMKRIFKVHS